MEVVLAIGVLSLAILALLGLFGPTVRSVRDVVDADEVNRAISQVNNALAMDPPDPEPTPYQPGTHGLSFEDAFDAASGGETYLIWTTRPGGNFQGPAINHFDTLANGTTAISAALSSGELEGPVMAAVFQRADVGTGNPYAGPVADQAYVPILVSLVRINPSRLDSGSYTFATTRGALDIAASTGITEADIIMEYTSAKVR